MGVIHILAETSCIPVPCSVSASASGGVCLLAQLCPTLATPWTIAHQSPLSIDFPRQEYWSRLPFPPPGDLPDPGIKPRCPAWEADSLPTEPPGKPGNRTDEGYISES